MSKVLVIGGAVVDFFAYPKDKMILHDSNPGYILKSFGGVGRNIAENLTRLAVDTTLITVIGDDEMGSAILKDSESVGLKIISKQVDSTPIYLSILDEHHEDLIGVAAMDQILALDAFFIELNQDLVDAADLVVVDTNLSVETLEYIFENVKKNIYVDAISSQKAIKLKPFLSKIHGLKVNLLEAELLTGIKYETIEDLNLMGDYFIECGVKEIFITLGSIGAYYTNMREAIFRNALPVEIKNSTGAGDSFFAGAIYAKLHHKNPLSYAMANAAINLESDYAVSKELTVDKLEKVIKEYRL